MLNLVNIKGGGGWGQGLSGPEEEAPCSGVVTS